MRIKWLTNISTSMAIVLSLGLSVAIYMGLKKSREPYHLLLQYNAIVLDVQLRIRHSIETYLKNGDATQLSAAQHQLEEVIASKIPTLPEQLTAEVLPVAQTLKDFLATDLRASGKLSGDPQALLIHAESEMADYLSLLNDYARAGRRRNPRSAHLFSAYSAQSLELIQKLVHSRQKYFTGFEKQHKDYIFSVLSEAANLLDKLRSLPRLGIFTSTDEDELTLGESTPKREEKSTVYIAELSSLLRRYGAELERTEQNIAAVKASHAQVYALMTQLDDKLALTTDLVNARYNDINSTITAISIVVVMLLISVMVGINVIQRRTISNFLRVGPHLADYAKGDLRSPIVFTSRFVEIQSLQASANTLREQLAGLIREIKGKANSIHETGQILTQTSDEMHTISQQQLMQTSQSASAVHELTMSIQQIAGFTKRAADAATTVDKSATAGCDTILTTINSINHLVTEVEETAAIISQLENKSQDIETVLSVIEEIAEQTNLLALNAAIEAARAGEHGRGFAVVADEVRQLSQRTSQSTRQIKTIIDDLQHMTSQTVSHMNRSVTTGLEATSRTQEASESLQEIVESVGTIRDQSTMIASVVDQQAAAAAGIDENIQLIQEFSEKAVETVDTTHSQSGQLAQLSESLRLSVEKFQIPT